MMKVNRRARSNYGATMRPYRPDYDSLLEPPDDEFVCIHCWEGMNEDDAHSCSQCDKDYLCSSCLAKHHESHMEDDDDEEIGTEAEDEATGDDGCIVITADVCLHMDAICTVW